jgi:hypothetical protein
MNRVFTFIFVLTGFLTSGQGLMNKGAFIVVSPSTCVTISGSSGNFTNDSSSTTELKGNLYLQGNLTNSATFTSISGMVNFFGTTNQTVGGNSTAFFNLVDSNILAQLIVNMPVLKVKNRLTLKGSKIFLQNNEIKLGTFGSPPTPGTLVRNSGWFYGTGKFTRWFSNTTPFFLAGSVSGLFPFGDSATNYQPFWFGSAANIAGSGTISVSHNPSISGTIPVSYHDNSWGYDVVAISKAAWKVMPDSGFALGSPSGEISFGGDGFVPFVSTDINATLFDASFGTYGTFGTYVVPYVNGSYFEVRREDINDWYLNKTWYIGTRDLSTTPLPVELISFNGECHNGIVTLKWSTATETNNRIFTIERSSDGFNWVDITEITGAGNSNQLINYIYSDENFSEYAVYYKLKQTDVDGKISYFPPITVNCAEGDGKLEVNVYPIPFKEQLTVEIHNFLYNHAIITVFDVLGNKVIERNLSGILNHEIKAQFNLGKLAAGMYYIEVNSAAFKKNIKIIKN